MLNIAKKLMKFRFKLLLTVVLIVLALCGGALFLATTKAHQLLAMNESLSADCSRLRGELAANRRKMAALARTSLDSAAEVADLKRRLAQLKRKELEKRLLPPSADDDLRRHLRAQEAMEAMRSRLEAGEPIHGSALTILNGQPTAADVSLIIGKETRVVSDDGIYSILPTLTKDGWIQYRINLQPSGSSTTSEQKMPTVIAAPGTDFQVGGANGTTFAFVSTGLDPN
jgi:hypothetical protein